MNDFFVLLFIFVLGLLAGGVGAIWLIAPLVGREEAHRALAWHFVQRRVRDITAQARERMQAAVDATQQPASVRPVRPAGSSAEDRPTGRDFSQAKRQADQATRTPR